MIFQSGLGLNLLLSKVTKEFYTGGFLEDRSVTTEADTYPSGELGLSAELFPGDAVGFFLVAGAGWAFDSERAKWFNSPWVGGGLRLSIVGNNLLGLGGGYKFGEEAYPLFWAEFDLTGKKLWGVLSPFIVVGWRQSSSQTKLGSGLQYTLTTSTTSNVSASLGIRARLSF